MVENWVSKDGATRIPTSPGPDGVCDLEVVTSVVDEVNGLSLP